MHKLRRSSCFYPYYDYCARRLEARKEIIKYPAIIGAGFSSSNQRRIAKVEREIRRYTCSAVLID